MANDIMGVVIAAVLELQGVKDLPKLENSAFCFLCSFTYSLLVLGFGADRWQYRLQ